MNRKLVTARRLASSRALSALALCVFYLGATAQSPAPLKPAVPLVSPASWITTYDYPASAAREELAGRVSFRVAVSPEGRVTNCVIVASSGVPELDQATCSAVSRNARFKPDVAASSFASTVRWELPKPAPVAVTAPAQAPSPSQELAAPQRTVASAQSFLAQVLPSQSATLDWSGERGTWNGVMRTETITAPGASREERRVITLPSLPIRSVASSAPCTTEVSVRPVRSTYRRHDSIREFDTDGSPSGPFPIVWRNVSEVVQTGTRIDLRGIKIRINMASAQAATRVAFAMEFLRQNCDPTAATGF